MDPVFLPYCLFWSGAGISLNRPTDEKCHHVKKECLFLRVPLFGGLKGKPKRKPTFKRPPKKDTPSGVNHMVFLLDLQFHRPRDRVFKLRCIISVGNETEHVLMIRE